MTQVLAISGKEFKINIRMLKALVEKVNNIYEQQRDRNYKKKVKWKLKNKKYCNRNEECLLQVQ